MINLTSKSLYGLAAAIELAMAPPQTSLQIRDIAKVQRIPENYLRQLLVTMKKAGIVQSVRGKHGGYVLARPSSQITVLDIITQLDGPAAHAGALLKDTVLRSYLAERGRATEALFLTTLEKLVEEKRHAEQCSYHI